MGLPIWKFTEGLFHHGAGSSTTTATTFPIDYHLWTLQNAPECAGLQRFEVPLELSLTSLHKKKGFGGFSAVRVGELPKLDVAGSNPVSRSACKSCRILELGYLFASDSAAFKP